MVLELKEVMSILKDENITEKQAEELVKKLEVISHHVIKRLVEEATKNDK